jgi:hypothetical protein
VIYSLDQCCSFLKNQNFESARRQLAFCANLSSFKIEPQAITPIITVIIGDVSNSKPVQLALFMSISCSCNYKKHIALLKHNLLVLL